MKTVSVDQGMFGGIRPIKRSGLVLRTKTNFVSTMTIKTAAARPATAAMKTITRCIINGALKSVTWTPPRRVFDVGGIKVVRAVPHGEGGVNSTRVRVDQVSLRTGEL